MIYKAGDSINLFNFVRNHQIITEIINVNQLSVLKENIIILISFNGRDFGNLTS